MAELSILLFLLPFVLGFSPVKDDVNFAALEAGYVTPQFDISGDWGLSTITVSGATVTVNWKSTRPQGTGSFTSANTISVNFPDDRTWVGTVVRAGGEIDWNNDAIWKRVSSPAPSAAPSTAPSSAPSTTPTTPVPSSNCDPTKCAGQCTPAGCQLYGLIGDSCGGSDNKQCEPCDVCKPNVLGLPYSKGKCAERTRCNNQWCDDGFCFITQISTGNVTYLTSGSAPPVTPDFTQRCVKWAQFEDRCLGGTNSPPLDYQYCAPPLKCFKNRGPSYGLCRLPSCSNDLCGYKGQQFVDAFCGSDASGNLTCKPYKKEGETCGGLGLLDTPFCEPSSLACVLESGKYVCRVSACLTTCTGEYCLPNLSDGTNAVCGGEGAPPPTTTPAPTTTTPAPTTPTPTPRNYYYGGSFVETSQAPSPLCCSARPLPPKPTSAPPPPPPPSPPTFMELVSKIKQTGCCPAVMTCPATVTLHCCSNPSTLCSSCTTSGLYSYPPPPAPY